MPPKKRRKPGPIPLAVRLAASNDLEDAEPWHQNMTPSFSEEVPTPSLTEVPAPSLAKERAPSLAKVRAPSSAEVLAPSLAKVRAPSLAKVPAPSSAEVLAPSLAKVRAPSLAKVRAPSSAEVLAPSLAKVRAPSLAKVRAPSSAEVRASSLAKERAPSSASHAEGPGSQEMNQLIGRIIRYLLSANRSKNVIQRPQLIKSAFGNYGKHYRLVMPIVKRKLSQTFGLRLIEFETSKYILVNAIENGKFHLQVPEDEKPCRMLLILILTHIFMLDGKSSEDSIWRFLRCLKIIEEDDFNSEYFGDVQKVVCTCC
ncbi:uncharacterized protein LOC105692504 isoform X2 [Athalia rosae]|uniref:uncharacterized protein LOC105692504 isoform X2 n=1 Tax=Athalia rosae TaxID=37344 RepID=UPI0020348D08|nr:uncharacterized protein LOC105692504 isoform X2 [Athalia rosae]